MSTLRLTTISNQSGSASVPSDTVINGSAKAWVNFNGSGTIAIRASFNVSSITDNGISDYTLNFTNAMSDTNYAIVATIGDTGVASGSSALAGCMPKTYATTSVRVLTGYGNTMTQNDWNLNNFAIFR